MAAPPVPHTRKKSVHEQVKGREYSVRYSYFFNGTDVTLKYVQNSVCGIVKKFAVGEVITMGLKVACRDLGIDCSYVARGETVEQLMAAGGKHAKEVHGYTDEQLNSPELIAKVKAAVKQE